MRIMCGDIYKSAVVEWSNLAPQGIFGISRDIFGCLQTKNGDMVLLLACSR